MKIKIKELYNLNETIAKELLAEAEYGWEVLPKIGDFIIALGNSLDQEKFNKIDDNVWVAKSATVAPTACIIGPAIIDENAEIRHSAFIRGKVIVGENTVIGNSVELKNCIIFNDAAIPHFNYVGDSIIGYKAHLGAGSITSNIKSDKTPVLIKGNTTEYMETMCVDDTFIKCNADEGTGKICINTGLKKCGAMVGDNAEIGCNCVLNPGTIVGKNSTIYPQSSVRGIVPENMIYKSKDEIVNKK